MNEGVVRTIAGKIRDVYNNCFNYTWFYIITEDLPIDPQVTREVREFLSYSPFEAIDLYNIRQGAEALNIFLKRLKSYFLPNLKELLHVSNLAPGYRISDKENYVKMRLLIEVIPANVETLEIYTSELLSALDGSRDEVFLNEILPMGHKIPVFVGE